MKVFGIGLNKTGTTSLGKALQVLGFKEHISWSVEDLQLYLDGRKEELLQKATRHNNFEDWPWPLLYKELYARYENARFILTLRSSPEQWYESLYQHALRVGPNEFRKAIFGYYRPEDNPQAHLDFYEKHNQEVIDFFNARDPSKLLVIDLSKGDGWEKLCRFLNKPLPNQAFPFVNQSSEKPRPTRPSRDILGLRAPQVKVKRRWLNWFKNLNK